MVIVKPKKRVLIVTKNETKTPKANLKKISPYKKDNTYRYIKNAAIATTAVAATAALTTGLYKLYQDAQKDKKEGVEVVDNALSLESADKVRAREEQEKAVLQAQAELAKKEAAAEAERQRIANEKAAAEQAIADEKAAAEAERQRIADEKAEAERLQKEQQIIQEAQALEAERIRLEGIAAIEKAKEEQRLADEKEKQRIADEQARVEIEMLANEKAAQIKLRADAADKRLQEAKQRRIDIEQAAADKAAADKIQAAKQREQYLEAEKLAKIKKVEDEKIKALAKQRELNNLYAEFAKTGFRVSDEELANVYENFIKFSEHREKNCLVTSGKCPDCFAASRFQMCLAKGLKNNNVDFNKIINIMKEFHYDISELGVGDRYGLQFRKDVTTGNLHLRYPVKENAKIM